MKTVVVALFLGLALPSFSAAQDRSQTLADIRQDLSLLYVEVQKLKRELSTTSAPTISVSADSLIARIDAIESELQRLTASTEELDFKVSQVIKDGTNRIGDLEFRLVELEGGDVSQLGETTTLGGVMDAPAAVVMQSTTQDMAIGEQADFDLALSAFDTEKFAEAADLFARFNQNYPNSPLSAEAYLQRGKALLKAADPREAASAFLDSFSNFPTSPVAPEALFSLGKTLGQLGKIDEGCQILSQLEIRFPESDFVQTAQQELSTLSCL